MKPSKSQKTFDKEAEQARDAHLALSPAHHSGGFDAPDHSQNDWQHQREQILHRACQGVQTRIEHGEKPRKAFRRVSRNCDGRRYKCDPKRRLALAESTLRAHYRKWRKSGEVPAAFRLHYRPRRLVFTAPVLIRFLNFIVENPQRSRRQAWRKFARLGGNFGSGRRAGKPLKISVSQLCYNFPASWFSQIRTEQKVIGLAQKNIVAIRLTCIAKIRERFPDRPPRRRVKREITFEI